MNSLFQAFIAAVIILVAAFGVYYISSSLNDTPTYSEVCTSEFGPDTTYRATFLGRDDDPERSAVVVCELANGTVRSVELEGDQLKEP